MVDRALLVRGAEIDIERRWRAEHRGLLKWYPAVGERRRELYAKHLAFFRFGATCQVRGFIAANRVGKTRGAGGYEMAVHLTGRYPDWWEGARFERRAAAIAAGDTRTSVRNIIQQALLGDWGRVGTGMIPGDDIIRVSAQPGVPDAAGTIWVRHHDADGREDGRSRLDLRSYDQGREAFQGTSEDVIWLDEESDEHIRGECLLRLMTTDGILMETFTPLKGVTPIVMGYMPAGYEEGQTVVVSENKALVMAGWDDVPHLTEAQKAAMRAETPPHLIDARSRGIPSLGAGAIYPLVESEILVDDMALPAHWPRAYALDVGWNRTAALWGARDPETKVVYLYAEYYRGQAEPPIHAAAIKARGEWIPGVIDPASFGRGQADGESLIRLYRQHGLDVRPADNDVESGILAVWQGLSTGGVKVFRSLQNWRAEYRMYRRDEKGRIVKEKDHLMDDTRYLLLSGMKRAKTAPARKTAVPAYVSADPGAGM